MILYKGVRKLKLGQLRKIPIEECKLTIPATIISERKGYGGSAEVYEKHQYTYQATVLKEILIVTIFSGGDFKCRIFLTKDDFCNEIVEKKEFSTAMFNNISIFYDRYYYGAAYIPAEDADKVITDFINKNSCFYVRTGDFEKKSGLRYLQKYEEVIRDHQLKEKYRKIKESIDFEMLKIKPVPEKIFKWINDKVFEGKNYIFYNPQSHTAECSKCGKKFSVPNTAKHREKYYCPHCKTKATLISVNRWHGMNEISETCYFRYIQPIKNGFIVRSFETIKFLSYKPYSNYTDENYRSIVNGESFNSNIKISELNRTFYEGYQYQKSFTYGNFNQTGEYRWCLGEATDYRFEMLVYPYNLETIIKRDEQLKYIPVKKIFELSDKLDFAETLISCKKHPCVEYLYKMRFYKLTYEVCKYGSIYSAEGTRKNFGFNYNGKNIMELLGVEKQDIKLLVSLNIDSVDLELFKTVKEKRCFNLEAFKWCQKNSGGESHSNFYKMLEYVTLVKAVNFIKKNLAENTSIRTLLYDWEDYRRECEKLNYPITEDVLFPSDFYKAHERTTELTKLLESKDRCDKCRKGCEEQAELFKEFCFKDNKYCIRLADTPEEIVAEGAILHHCVGGYLEQHSEGKTHIFVIRKPGEENKPFYTLELSKSLRLIQCRGYKNNREDNEEQQAEHKLVDEFVDKWLKALVNKKKEVA